MKLTNALWLAAGTPLLAGCGTTQPAPCTLLGGGGVVSVQEWDGGLADGGAITNGTLDPASCTDVCSGTANRCTIIDAGLVECTLVCTGGRAPPGLISLSTVDDSAGSWLARMAELEAAAVHAFLHLAKELDAHGLPRFADAAVRAAVHETEHATKVTRLALQHGHAPAPLSMKDTEVRSLAGLAIDNAGEGCGRELFGAVLNEHQARTATDASVARVMREIAGEERQHADLSFALAEALMPRLTLAQRRQAREAQADVLERLGADEVTPAMRTSLGLMDQAQASATARRLLDTRRL
jgi:rubrerythrin